MQRRLVNMTDRRILIVVVFLCTFGVSKILAASKNIPKWKKQTTLAKPVIKYGSLVTHYKQGCTSGSDDLWIIQACEAPATQNESSHYVCDDNGDMKCLPGWIGDLCDVPICKKGCDPIQGYCKRPNECRCKLGFYGEMCNKCIALPGCQHGYCDNSFECKCLEGWDGIFCSEPVCHEDCHSSKGYCDWPGECKCRLGWTGDLCKECQPLPGCMHGTCSKPLECRCEKGWQGILCQIPVCSDGCHRDRGYCRKPNECRCKVGWWGKNCTQCFPYPGCVHGTCNRPWECNCKSGWGGMLCDQELKYCETHNVTCQNGATCVSLPEEDGNYRCLCAEGFIGRNCEVDKKKVEIVGLMPPKPSLLLLKKTTTTPSSVSEDLLLESDDEYEEDATKPSFSISSMINENETLNETI